MFRICTNDHNPGNCQETGKTRKDRRCSVGAGVGWMWGGDACVALVPGSHSPCQGPTWQHCLGKRMQPGRTHGFSFPFPHLPFSEQSPLIRPFERPSHGLVVIIDEREDLDLSVFKRYVNKFRLRSLRTRIPPDYS